jgi:hypothetical protein
VTKKWTAEDSCNESSVSIKYWEFLQWLNVYRWYICDSYWRTGYFLEYLPRRSVLIVELMTRDKIYRVAGTYTRGRNVPFRTSTDGVLGFVGPFQTDAGLVPR